MKECCMFEKTDKMHKQFDMGKLELLMETKYSDGHIHKLFRCQKCDGLVFYEYKKETSMLHGVEYVRYYEKLFPVECIEEANMIENNVLLVLTDGRSNISRDGNRCSDGPDDWWYTDGRMRDKMQCPVCGYYTIDDEYDICPVCFWEDTRVQSREPNVWGGANGPSLIMARENFRQFGASSKRFVEYCRQPFENEKSGLQYSFPAYYYDDAKGNFYEGYKNSLSLKFCKYGTPFDSPMREGIEKYKLITERIAKVDSDSEKWANILEKSEREYIEDWHNDEEYTCDDDTELFELVLYNCKERTRKISKSVRKLGFAEYVKKLATGDFKDGVLQLSDELLTQFEAACGYTVFEVLEMGDEECERIYMKLCVLAETDEKYEELRKKIEGGWAELRWSVPKWMADWG